MLINLILFITMTLDYRVWTAASFRAASCSNCVSTSSPGNWTYLTTDPLMKQFLTESCKNILATDRTIIIFHGNKEKQVDFMLKDSYHVRIFVRVRDTDVRQFDIEILIYRMERTTNTAPCAGINIRYFVIHSL